MLRLRPVERKGRRDNKKGRRCAGPQAIATLRAAVADKLRILGLFFWVVTIRRWLGGQVPSPSAGHMLAPYGVPYKGHMIRAQHVILLIFQWLNGRSCDG